MSSEAHSCPQWCQQGQGGNFECSSLPKTIDFLLFFSLLAVCPCRCRPCRRIDCMVFGSQTDLMVPLWLPVVWERCCCEHHSRCCVLMTSSRSLFIYNYVFAPLQLRLWHPGHPVLRGPLSETAWPKLRWITHWHIKVVVGKHHPGGMQGVQATPFPLTSIWKSGCRHCMCEQRMFFLFFFHLRGGREVAWVWWMKIDDTVRLGAA